ncbi:MAG TPA: YcjX family protein [Rhizobiales bacterium]|nr:YcjX family protein [Hyphomicrobiales bacterium]
MNYSELPGDALHTLGGIADFARHILNPTIRLGVTGLSRSGKTVFITALVNNLLHGGRLPAFSALAEGRLQRAWLQPQPDDNIPRFAYEDHLEALTGPDRHWPESTRQISQLRLTLEYEPQGWFGRKLASGRLNIDIVDYPGEWLLDIPLLQMSYEEWSRQALAQSEEYPRKPLAAKWRRVMNSIDPDMAQDEQLARKAARLFTEYLRACRDEKVSLSTLPPGRFLMPGDLEGSPALTFSPLPVRTGARVVPESLHAMMKRRFESYKSHIVKPFFRDHFSRLDRQIVLVDALSALNAGPAAVRDLEQALTEILLSFRPGKNSWLSAILSRRIDKILFAASKADHLHHTSHDRLQNILALLTKSAMNRAKIAGADVSALAMASVRATREASVRKNGNELDCIAGIPIKGERLGSEVFDGEEELAIFPGDLPENPADALRSTTTGAEDLRFIRFRPPLINPEPVPILPHIRLDRAIEFLLGDHLT